MAEDDIAWRSPAPAGAYPGPPRPPAPDPSWRPMQDEPIPAPRRLPELDEHEIDQAEKRAAWVTYALGAGALAVLLVLTIARVGG
jgi:hypothetical protein